MRPECLLRISPAAFRLGRIPTEAAVQAVSRMPMPVRRNEPDRERPHIVVSNTETIPPGIMFICMVNGERLRRRRPIRLVPAYHIEMSYSQSMKPLGAIKTTARPVNRIYDVWPGGGLGYQAVSHKVHYLVRQSLLRQVISVGLRR